MSQQPPFGEFAPVTYAQWRAQIKDDDFERKLVTRTVDGIRIAPLYAATDVPSGAATPIPAAPGGGWEIRQDAPAPTAEADPVGSLARHGFLTNTLDAARIALVARATEALRDTPTKRVITVSSSIFHDAGAGPALETGISIATYVTYLRWLTDAGIAINDAVRTIEVSCSVATDFFGEIAKLRALRLCLAKVIAHSGGTLDPSKVAIHARMSRRSLTQRDPWVNMLRATTEAFAAAAGGANAITTDSYDSLLGSESDLGRRIAENAQIILDEESHVRAVTDPAAGSYYVESLTQEIARAAWKTFTEIETAGGIVAALQNGSVHTSIKAHADKSQAEIRTRKRPITGVSEFALINEPPATSPNASATPATNTSAAVSIEPLRATRISAPYEALRDRSDAYLAQHGKRPQLFLCNVGGVNQWKPRAGFTQNFAWAGGIDALGAEHGFATADEAVTAFAASGARLAAICSSDDSYPQLIPQLARALRERGAALVVVAGKPGEHEVAYREAGVGLFIHVGCDVVSALDAMLNSTGAKS